MDVVEALRKQARSESRFGSCYPPVGLTTEAADTIERLRQQVVELRDALVQAAIPLEAINGSVSWELCKPLQESVSVAVKILRSTLPATAPKGTG